MAYADLRLVLEDLDGTTQTLELDGERLRELLNDSPEEDQPLVLARWLEEYVGADGQRVCDRDRPAMMDAVFAALAGIPLDESPLIHLEERTVPAVGEVERDEQALLIAMRREPALWVASSNLVRAQQVVEHALIADGFVPLTWTAAQASIDEFIPGGVGRISQDDPLVQPLTAALEHQPSDPTAYVFVDPDTNDHGLESRSAREHLRNLATRVAHSRGRLRLVVLKAHADIPDRFLGLLHPYRLAFAGSTPLLDRLAEDLTAKARNRDVPIAPGREDILRKIIVILNERSETPNVPLLLGIPGSGKSAIVEELARLIARDDPSIPVHLRRRRILSLPASAFNSGNTPDQQMQRIETIARELEVNRELMLVFLDEAHELMADVATGQGQPAAVQHLKAGLARGLYPLILATTPNEAARIERDAAFMRRTVPVPLDELSPRRTEDVLLRVWVPRLCRQHDLVAIDKEAVSTAVDASGWYLPGLARPAGPIRVLSRAASMRELAGRRTIDEIAVWEAVSDLLGRRVGTPSIDDPELWAVVDRLATELPERIIGQGQAFERLRPSLVSYLFRPPRAERKPLVLLFIGAPGVGKTESAGIISEIIFGEPPIIYDMAAYHDEHQAASLVGAPAGYVLSTEGARIVSDIRSRPNGRTVMLFDEFGRAHPNIPQRLMGVFDRGTYRDSLGREGDFRDTIMILTSNDVMDVAGRDENELREELLTAGSSGHGLDAAIISRLDGVVAFAALGDEIKQQIAAKLLARLEHELRSSYGLDCVLGGGVAPQLAAFATDALGVRPMRERARRLEAEALDANWYCPLCNEPHAGDACPRCGLLRELAPADAGRRIADPVIEHAVLRGRILEEIEPEGLPRIAWPWLTYLTLGALAWLYLALGLARIAPPWLFGVAAVAAILVAGVTAFIRRDGVVQLARRLAGGFLPRRQFRRWLRVEPLEGPHSVLVSIDNPVPWPPNGVRRHDADAVIEFQGEMYEDENRFAADRMVPPGETGRPIIQGGGFGQSLIWTGAVIGAVALILAIRG
ncbi:MAG: AAA family ATPase [Chloroflexota bacterium]